MRMARERLSPEDFAILDQAVATNDWPMLFGAAAANLAAIMDVVQVANDPLKVLCDVVREMPEPLRKQYGRGMALSALAFALDSVQTMHDQAVAAAAASKRSKKH
jgi:hypothetical protein